MPLFKIPILRRWTGDGRGRPVLAEVDDVGLYYYADNQSPADMESVIRRSITLVERDFFLIESPGLDEAIRKLRQFEGFKTGRRYPAMWVDVRDPVVQYPECDRRHADAEGEYYCECFEDDPYPPGCIVLGYDPPDSCPVKKQRDEATGPRPVEVFSEDPRETFLLMLVGE